jgi:hypothetical protein
MNRSGTVSDTRIGLAVTCVRGETSEPAAMMVVTNCLNQGPAGRRPGVGPVLCLTACGVPEVCLACELQR